MVDSIADNGTVDYSISLIRCQIMIMFLHGIDVMVPAFTGSGAFMSTTAFTINVGNGAYSDGGNFEAPDVIPSWSLLFVNNK